MRGTGSKFWCVLIGRQPIVARRGRAVREPGANFVNPHSKPFPIVGEFMREIALEIAAREA
jgi:hypothetical protein